MGSFLRIEQVRDQFSKSEEKIANYIIANESKIPKMNVKDFAESVGTSSASIVRFAKKLGYRSFIDFRLSFLEYLKESSGEPTVYEAVKKNDTTSDLIQKIGTGNAQAILDTIKHLDEKTIELAVDEILRANRIFFFGVGQSGLVAEDFQLKLMRIGKHTEFFKDTHSQLSASVHLRKGDLAIGISNSGESVEVVKALKKAKERGSSIITITRLGKNPVSDLADLAIRTVAEEKNMRTGAIVSRIAQLTIVDILFVGVAKNSFDSIQKDIHDTRAMVEDFKVTR